MSTPFKRTAAAGFTLIELLIVVIILAIISAIAIPQFSAATSDAQQSAADANLAAMRNAIELYRAQHANNSYPGVTVSTVGAACTGTAGTGAVNSEQSFKDQLTYASDKDCKTCSVSDPINYRYGPYLRQGIPTDPFGNSSQVVVTTTGNKLVPDTGAAAIGWKFDNKTGEFILNKAVPAT